MSKKLPFTKMQGIGNDYVYINGFEEQIQNPHELAIKISDRHFGVGSDGIVLILPSATADIRMRMFNSDGTEAEMCGNASRCVGKLAYDLHLVKKNIISLETAAGIKIIKLHFDGQEVCGATVDMGEPVLAPNLIPLNMAIFNESSNNSQQCLAFPVRVQNNNYLLTAVSMGNPHAVLFMNEISNLDLQLLGPDFENLPLFPKKTNTEFVKVISRTKIRMRVWERGAGETMACGTGACAAVVACVLNGLTERSVEVGLLGGKLQITWDEANNHIFMSGPAVTVFTGQFYI